MRKFIMSIGALIIVIIIILALVTWRYPFSAISFYHSITFDQDKVILKEYKKELRQFNNYYQQHQKQHDITSERMQYILKVYQMPFLIDENPMKVSKNTLDQIITDLRETRNNIIELGFTQDYDADAKRYLKLMLQDFISVEEQAQHLRNATGDSRSVLKLQIRNLRTSIESNLNHLVTFYKLYTKARE